MAGELTGKVAVVTGAASGIGAATAEVFVEEGARVVLADVDVDAGTALAERLGGAAVFCRTDVADAESVQAAVDTAVSGFGGLHVMVNNAGIPSRMGPFLDDDFSDFSRVLGVNLLGVMLGTQRAARHMKDHGGGSIVNTSSISALTGGASPISYRVAKAGVQQFTRSMATDLAQWEIRVNCIAPGHIQTAINSYDMGAVIYHTQPLQRRGSARDVANAFLYFASDRSAQVTGTILPVDGGTVAGQPPHVMRDVLKQAANRG